MKFKSSFSRIPKHQKFEYRPRYAKEDEHIDEDKPFKIRKGGYFSSSKYELIGAFKNEPISYQKRKNLGRKRSVLVYAVMIMALITAIVVKGDNPYIVGVGAGLLLIFAVLFIFQNNKL